MFTQAILSLAALPVGEAIRVNAVPVEIANPATHQSLGINDLEPGERVVVLDHSATDNEDEKQHVLMDGELQRYKWQSNTGMRGKFIRFEGDFVWIKPDGRDGDQYRFPRKALMTEAREVELLAEAMGFTAQDDDISKDEALADDKASELLSEAMGLTANDDTISEDNALEEASDVELLTKAMGLTAKDDTSSEDKALQEASEVELLTKAMGLTATDQDVKQGERRMQAVSSHASEASRGSSFTSSPEEVLHRQRDSRESPGSSANTELLPEISVETQEERRKRAITEAGKLLDFGKGTAVQILKYGQEHLFEGDQQQWKMFRNEEAQQQPWQHKDELGRVVETQKNKEGVKTGYVWISREMDIGEGTFEKPDKEAIYLYPRYLLEEYAPDDSDEDGDWGRYDPRLADDQ